MTEQDPRTNPGAVVVRDETDRVVVVLDGEIDITYREQLAEAREAAVAAGKPIDIDAQRLTFADSSAMAFLAMLVARSRQRVRMLDVAPAIRDLLDLLDISEILEIVDRQSGESTGT